MAVQTSLVFVLKLLSSPGSWFSRGEEEKSLPAAQAFTDLCHSPIHHPSPVLMSSRYLSFPHPDLLFHPSDLPRLALNCPPGSSDVSMQHLGATRKVQTTCYVWLEPLKVRFWLFPHL